MQARDGIELRNLRVQRSHQLANGLIEFGNLSLQQIDEFQCALDEPPMMRSALPGQGQFQCRQLATQRPQGEGGQLPRLTLTRNQGGQHATSTRREQVCNHTRELDMGIF